MSLTLSVLTLNIWGIPIISKDKDIRVQREPKIILLSFSLFKLNFSHSQQILQKNLFKANLTSFRFKKFGVNMTIKRLNLEFHRNFHTHTISTLESSALVFACFHVIKSSIHSFTTGL